MLAGEQVDEFTKEDDIRQNYEDIRQNYEV
jgi:hypothetical protein